MLVEEKKGRKVNKSVLSAVFGLILLVESVVGVDIPDKASITPADIDHEYLVLGGPVDTDKSHYGIGSWGVNYYDDLNGNGSHDPFEPFGDSAQTGWNNPVSNADNSCWMASACNMLEQLGVISSAQGLYDYYALNGVQVGSSIYTWDEGGRQEYIIQDWMDNNPAIGSTMQMNLHFVDNQAKFSNGFYAWKDFEPRSAVANYLANGWQVGIGMWPVYSDGSHAGGHALTIQEILPTAGFTCTDSDRDFDYVNGAGDLNTYMDAKIGPGSYGGSLYYGWYNDFYDGQIGYYPAGDIGYIVAVIPEPATAAIFSLGAMVLITRKSYKG